MFKAREEDLIGFLALGNETGWLSFELFFLQETASRRIRGKKTREGKSRFINSIVASGK
jgi:hypothetical protein